MTRSMRAWRMSCGDLRAVSRGDERTARAGSSAAPRYLGCRHQVARCLRRLSWSAAAVLLLLAFTPAISIGRVASKQPARPSSKPADSAQPPPAQSVFRMTPQTAATRPAEPNARRERRSRGRHCWRWEADTPPTVPPRCARCSVASPTPDTHPARSTASTARSPSARSRTSRRPTASSSTASRVRLRSVPSGVASTRSCPVPALRFRAVRRQ